MTLNHEVFATDPLTAVIPNDGVAKVTEPRRPRSGPSCATNCPRSSAKASTGMVWNASCPRSSATSARPSSPRAG